MNLRPGPRISSPSDLLALVPTALGFHPEHSLVVVVTAGEVGQLHARVDLPHYDEADEVAEVFDVVIATVRKARAHQLALLAYCDDEELAEDVVDLVLDRLEALDVDVLWAVRADGERWYSLDPVSTCAPDEGVPYDLSSHPITVQAVLDGRVTFDSRDDLADSLVGTDLDAIERVQRSVDEAVRGLAAAGRHPLGMDSPEGLRAHLMTEGYWVRQRVRRYVQNGEPFDDAEVGRLVAAVVQIDVRDVAWAEMTRADAPAHVELWRDVVRRTPPDLLAAPAALLAFAAWLAGEGALAWCAVERCHDADPGYNMATLVSQALAGAVHPSTWRPIPGQDLPLFAG